MEAYRFGLSMVEAIASIKAMAVECALVVQNG